MTPKHTQVRHHCQGGRCTATKPCLQRRGRLQRCLSATARAGEAVPARIQSQRTFVILAHDERALVVDGVLLVRLAEGLEGRIVRPIAT